MPELPELRILLVEDHVETLQSLCLWLAARGYHVRSFCTIAAACRFARDNAFDILITDIGLPDGTGWELLEKLRPLGNFRAVAITGLAGAREHELSRIAGFSRLMEKPFDPAILHAFLRAIEVERRESAMPSRRAAN